MQCDGDQRYGIALLGDSKVHTHVHAVEHQIDHACDPLVKNAGGYQHNTSAACHVGLFHGGNTDVPTGEIVRSLGINAVIVVCM